MIYNNIKEFTKKVNSIYNDNVKLYIIDDKKQEKEVNNMNNLQKNICVICGYEYQGYGNNAEPVKSGQCCTVCNSTVVIPARIKLIDDKKPIKRGK